MISTISVQITGLFNHCNTIATPFGKNLRVRHAAPVGVTVSAQSSCELTPADPGSALLRHFRRRIW